MAQKFILQGDSLRISASVEFHLELVAKPANSNNVFRMHTPLPPEPVKGGGWWHVNEKEKFLLLYSASTDFGPVALPDLIDACPQTHFSFHWDGYQVYYSDRIKLEEALENKALIFQIER